MGFKEDIGEGGLGNGGETTQKASVSTVALGNRRLKGERTEALAIGCGGILTG